MQTLSNLNKSFVAKNRKMRRFKLDMLDDDRGSRNHGVKIRVFFEVGCDLPGELGHQ